MVVHTARAESRVKCNAPSLPPLFALPSPPAGGRTGLVLVWLDIPDIWKPTPTQLHNTFFFDERNKFITKVAVIVWTEILGDLDEEY